MVAGRWRAPLPLMINNRTSSPRKEHGAPAKRRGKDENGENGGDLFHNFVSAPPPAHHVALAISVSRPPWFP